ncbi:MAG: potassium/proton antiporter [Saccharofermentanales bacterium]|jgi:cell volume regulation protein A|nr:potassium/proton antiporter [Clostridiaceae bacterium]
MIINILIVIAVIVMMSVLLSVASDKSGIPMLLFFIVFGMVIGETMPIMPTNAFEIANKVCSIALIFIMFYGGFGTSWRAAKPVAGKALILASFGVFLTAAITGIFVHFVIGFPLIESLLLGSVIGSTDAASVFSILRRRKLSLKDSTDSLLEMESGSNDPFSYILTIVCLALLVEGISPGQAFLTLFLQVSVGVAVGAVISIAIVFFIRKNIFFKGGGNEVFTIAIALLGYALAELLSGNGYLSVYIIGIVLGNQDFKSKRDLVAFFEGINMLAQITIFFILGLLSDVRSIISVFPIALAIMAFMTLISRPVSVFGLMAFMPNSSLQQKIVVSWAGIRGAASIVFSIVAVSSVELHYDLFHIIFTIVLLSLAIQGGLLPTVAIRTNMYDPHGDVMRTFTDYEDEKNVQFVATEIYEGHPWIGKALKDVFLPQDIRVTIVERDDEQFIPDGETVIELNDGLILSALHYKEKLGNFSLRERVVKKDDRFDNKYIRDIKLRKNERVILLERNGDIIIPTGDVQMREDDIIVINHIR